MRVCHTRKDERSLFLISASCGVVFMSGQAPEMLIINLSLLVSYKAIRAKQGYKTLGKPFAYEAIRKHESTIVWFPFEYFPLLEYIFKP